MVAMMIMASRRWLMGRFMASRLAGRAGLGGDGGDDRGRASPCS